MKGNEGTVLTETLPIGGMTCAACSARVEKAIRRLEGVESAAVNLATEKTTVIYDPGFLRLSSVKEAITKAGYQVLDAPKKGLDEDRIRREKELKALRAKFIVAASFALPLLYVAMVPMISGLSLATQYW